VSGRQRRRGATITSRRDSVTARRWNCCRRRRRVRLIIRNRRRWSTPRAPHMCRRRRRRRSRHIRRKARFVLPQRPRRRRPSSRQCRPPGSCSTAPYRSTRTGARAESHSLSTRRCHIAINTSMSSSPSSKPPRRVLASTGRRMPARQPETPPLDGDTRAPRRPLLLPWLKRSRLSAESTCFLDRRRFCFSGESAQVSPLAAVTFRCACVCFFCDLCPYSPLYLMIWWFVCATIFCESFARLLQIKLTFVKNIIYSY